MSTVNEIERILAGFSSISLEEMVLPIITMEPK